MRFRVECMVSSFGLGNLRGLHHTFRGPNQVGVRYRGTSLIRNSPSPWGQHRALGAVLLQGPRGGFAVSDERGAPVTMKKKDSGIGFQG